MNTQPNDFVMQANWQRWDGYLRAMQVLADGVSQLVKVQLELRSTYAPRNTRRTGAGSMTFARRRRRGSRNAWSVPGDADASDADHDAGRLQAVARDGAADVQAPAEAAAQHQSEAASRGSARKNKPVAP